MKKRQCSHLLWLACALLLIAPGATLAQSPTPDKIVRDFYSWYLHALTVNNSAEPLKQKTTALKYLTPQLYAAVPRLEARLTADIFVCAQDWDDDWEKNFVVDPVAIKGASATTLVALTSGANGKLRIKVTLKRVAVGWRIDHVACAK